MPDELKTTFTSNHDVRSYETRSSDVFDESVGNTIQFGINTLSSTRAKLWNKFYFELLNKVTNRTIFKLETLLKTNILNT